MIYSTKREKILQKLQIFVDRLQYTCTYDGMEEYKMKDPRIEKLAKNLIHYSLRLQKGEKVLIENFGLQRELVIALVREAYAVGAYPFVSLKDHQVDRALLLGAQEEQFSMMAEFEANVMKEMDAYIGLRAGDNINEFADVPADKMKIHGKRLCKSASGHSCTENEMGRAPLSESVYGAARENEHRGV